MIAKTSQRRGKMKDRKLSEQCEEVLAYMKEHGSITPAEAIDMGIYRLSGRIYDLKDRGYAITTTMTEGKNRHGKRTRFAKYRLAEKEGV